MNLSLITSRGIERLRIWDQAIGTDTISIHHALSIKEVNYSFPLYLFNRVPISV